MTRIDSARRMVDAARAWLDTLEDEQRAAALVPWPATEERHRWFYTPTDHGGLPLLSMRPAQQSLAMQLVATGLSRAGYVTASTIMGLENVLDQVEGWHVDWGRERGRDPQLYWLRVFGSPSLDGPWSWRFGGHHVSIHHLVLEGRVQSSSPAFLGSDPAASPLTGGHLLRPLGATEDLARDLVRSLDSSQAARGVINAAAPVDIVSGNRPRVREGDMVMPLPTLWRSRFTEPALRERVEATHIGAEDKAGFRSQDHEAVRLTMKAPRGIRGKDLSPAQQDVMRALLQVYVDRMPEDVAEGEAAKFAGTKLADIHFAWAGSSDPGRPHYYRLQGPRLLAEYDNTQRDANHVHTVWRDPEGDFGEDVLARHLATFHR